MKNLFLICVILLSHNVLAQFSIKKKYYDKDSIPTFVLFEETNYENGMETTLFKEQLKLTDNDELKLLGEFDDRLGETHKKFQQYYKGIKVEYGNYRLHIHQNKLKAISGNYVQQVKIPTIPVLPKQSALDLALNYINAKTYLWDLPNIEQWIKEEQNNNSVTAFPEGELVIWSNIYNQDFRLAYKFDIYVIEPLSRDYVFIDAHTGDLIEREPILKNSEATGIFTTRYSGQRKGITDTLSNSAYRLFDSSRGNGIHTQDMNRGTDFSLAVDFIDNNNEWTAAEWHNIDEDDAALEAHWALQQTYDYFKINHNRNSYDDNNAAIYCYVHYDYNMDNAGWDGSRIILGDGNVIFDNVCSIDVLAHEFGHAICQSTCNLRYQDESGALNEGLSDIWGICVEHYATPEKQNWRIGEDITLTAAALRAADNPNALTYQPNGTGTPTVFPDTYKGTGWYTGTWDYGGVHINNTVLSHWFFLLSQGGSGINDNGDSYQVTGLGIEDAARITYRMESVYLYTMADFEDARIFAIQSAEDLFGSNSCEVIQTTNAFYAVGVGNQYEHSLSGPELVCTTGSTFTLNNRPPGTKIS